MYAARAGVSPLPPKREPLTPTTAGDGQTPGPAPGSCCFGGASPRACPSSSSPSSATPRRQSTTCRQIGQVAPRGQSLADHAPSPNAAPLSTATAGTHRCDQPARRDRASHGHGVVCANSSPSAMTHRTGRQSPMSQPDRPREPDDGSVHDLPHAHIHTSNGVSARLARTSATQDPRAPNRQAR